MVPARHLSTIEDTAGGDGNVEAIGLATDGGDGVQAASGEARGGIAAAAGGGGGDDGGDGDGGGSDGGDSNGGDGEGDSGEAMMEDLPIDTIEYVFRYLDAFDAHRFGLTQSRALEVIRRERERAQTPGVETQYDRWFADADAKVTTLINNMCKECAEDPENEYAQAVQDELKGIDAGYWGDALWELITGTHHAGYDLDLEDFATVTVEGYEELTCFRLHRCTVCGLLNAEQYMSWDGMLCGWQIFDLNVQPKCLACS